MCSVWLPFLIASWSVHSQLHDCYTSHFDSSSKLLSFLLSLTPPSSLKLQTTLCVYSLVPSLTNRYVCLEQLFCQSLPQWQFCSQASALPTTFPSETLSLRNRGQRDDGWVKVPHVKVQCRRCVLKGWQWAHSGRHNTVLRPVKPAACESSPASSQHSPLQQSVSRHADSGVITKS